MGIWQRVAESGSGRKRFSPGFVGFAPVGSSQEASFKQHVDAFRARGALDICLSFVVTRWWRDRSRERERASDGEVSLLEDPGMCVCVVARAKRGFGGGA